MVNEAKREFVMTNTCFLLYDFHPLNFVLATVPQISILVIGVMRRLLL